MENENFPIVTENKMKKFIGCICKKRRKKC